MNWLMFAIVVVVFMFFILMLSLRMLLKKEKEFRGTCATRSPFLEKEGLHCEVCGQDVEMNDDCKKPRSFAKIIAQKFGINK